MPTTEQREIANLLGKAGTAHGVYEERELNGVYDQTWPTWYAAYLIEHGIGDLLGQAITTDQLARLLEQYDKGYRTQQRQESWPDYYAAQLLAWRDSVDMTLCSLMTLPTKFSCCVTTTPVILSEAKNL